jgi:hypothetical protein
LLGVELVADADGAVRRGEEGVVNGEGFVLDEGLNGGEAGELVIGDLGRVGVANRSQKRQADEEDEDGRGQSPGPDVGLGEVLAELVKDVHVAIGSSFRSIAVVFTGG